MRWLSGMLRALERRIIEAPPLAREELAAGLIAGMALMGLFTWLLLRWVARLPPDHFVRAPPEARTHPVLVVLRGVVRNVAGAALMALGVVMALPGVPGPGLVTVLIGFLLLDFPGKRALELRLLRRPRLRAAIDQLRARHGQPPLQLDVDAGDAPPR